jgi:hypothetical protein
MDEKNVSSAESCSEKPRRIPKWLWLIFILSDAIFVISVLLWFLWPFSPSHNSIAGPPLFKADGKQLMATVISPHLEAAIEPGKNVLWCSTFQLVWNESCRHAGGDIHLKDEPPMVAVLNKKLGNEKDVDTAGCLVMSGRVEEGIVGKIRQGLDRKFQGQADPDLLNRIESSLPPNGWLAYAYLFRELPFEYKFNRLEIPLEFGSKRVASFGIRDATCRMDDIHRADQVEVWDYKNDDDFVLELKPKDKSERIILAKVTPDETLLKTVETVRSRISSSKLQAWDKSLEMGESIVVPILNFDLFQDYDQLTGKQIITSGPLKGMPIGLAMQDIRFRLDEQGAILKSEAAEAKSAASERKRHHFIFNKPFLILLERKDAERPYFALWVDNPELLAPFN